MGSMVEKELGYSILCEVEQVWNPTDCVIFFSLSLLLGVASRHLFRGTRVPYTVALLVIGAALGALEYGTSNRLGRIGHGIRLWSRIDPDLLLAVFLPALLFESSFSMEFHQIKRCMAQMLLLAGPGVLISTFCIGSALKFIFPYNWSWKVSLLLGGLLSATDPVAVVALLKELGASKKLNTIIEGESLMNDGTAIVVYQLFYRMILGENSNWVAVIRYFTQVSLGAVGIGVAFGIVSTIWLRFIFNDTVMEIALTVVVSYVTYLTAQEVADVSGVLAVMTLGMFYAAIARTTFKSDGQQSLHHFWEMVAYIANTLIFILSGVVIAEGVLNSDNIFHNHGHSWGYLFLLYFFVQVSRFVVVLLLYPFLQYFGYGLNWKEATILLWAGLRGAVALSLSLSVKRASNSSMYLSSQTGSLFVFFSGGIVFLTLIVNGSTTQFFLLLLDMDKLSASKKHILEFTKYEMLNKAITAFRNLGDDEELGPVDWPSVKKYVSSLNYLEEECTHPHGASGFCNSLEPSDLEVCRTWLLNGVQAAYWGMLEEGWITKETADSLMHSVDEAMKSALVEPLCDWKSLKANVHISSYYKFLRTSIFLQELVTYFMVQQLESACYICGAFIRAHRIARRQLHDFIGDGDITSMVIKESKAEGEEARRVLEEVRVTFPRVLRFVKTRQVSYTVLKQLTDYIENLEEVGLLEEKEMLHLHYAIQKDLKKLLSHPPLLKIPKVTDLINAHPLMGGLPPGIRETLARSTKVMMKPRGAALYKEGSKANGVWLISNGIVKWTSKSISNKNSLHPTFTHGSTLGLCELLAGRNYIYDVVAESTVHCFYVESDKILSVLRSSPVVEDFLWQESVVTLAKVLHPRMFEDMAMQELRALVAEKSMLITYIRGESIEVPPHSISFLLEGFVKTHDFEQVIAPAALLPPQNQSSQTMGTSASFSHQDSWFKVETVARVIILDVASLEASCVLRTRSSSLVSSDHHHGPLRRDQCGFGSRPENCFEQRRHKQNVERIRRLANNSSAKAVRPSIFDSMVNDQSYSNSLSRNQAKMTRSVSFSRNASTNERLLVPTRSEGAAITTKKRKVDNFNKGRIAVQDVALEQLKKELQVRPTMKLVDDMQEEVKKLQLK